MDKKMVARELVVIAKSLMSNLNARILEEELADTNLKLEIKTVAMDVKEMADEDDTGVRSKMLVRDKARVLARKPEYISFYTGTSWELQRKIEAEIWETYHSESW